MFVWLDTARLLYDSANHSGGEKGRQFSLSKTPSYPGIPVRGMIVLGASSGTSGGKRTRGVVKHSPCKMGRVGWSRRLAVWRARMLL